MPQYQIKSNQWNRILPICWYINSGALHISSIYAHIIELRGVLATYKLAPSLIENSHK